MLYLLRLKDKDTGINEETLQFESNCVDFRIDNFDTYQDFVLFAEADTICDGVFYGVYHYYFGSGYKFEISYNFDYNRIMVTCYGDTEFNNFIDIIKKQLPQWAIR